GTGGRAGGAYRRTGPARAAGRAGPLRGGEPVLRRQRAAGAVGAGRAGRASGQSVVGRSRSDAPLAAAWTGRGVAPQPCAPAGAGAVVRSGVCVSGRETTDRNPQ